MDLEHLKIATDFREDLFTNGMMAELRKFLKVVDGGLFFELIKRIIPLSVLDNEHFPKDKKSFFATKIVPFESKLKSERKTSKTLSLFLQKELTFKLNHTVKVPGRKS